MIWWFRRKRLQLPPSEPQDNTAEPVRLRPEEALWLEQLIAAAVEGKRKDAIGGRDFWLRVDGLWNRGHERLAVEWLTKFITSPATPSEHLTALRLRLVELLEKRRDLGSAVPHLEALTAESEHTTRAHFLLAEHYRRRGDEVPAMRHYEAVLARDVDYPNVRVRLQRLRTARGEGTAAVGGETIAGPEAMGTFGGARYRLIRELGRGATAVVYLARDAQLDRDVAVKLLHPHLAASNRARACARFFDEARVAAALRHPNILAILDVDERARRIVMELAAGGTLRSVLRDRGARNLLHALELHTQILSALTAAHRQGIVHRDLKPGNLMFRRDADAPGAEIVLGDFGVAHLPNADGALGAARASRKASEAVGTLAYMSPEQRQGSEAKPSSDLYASAVVLYEMITGQTPWDRTTLLKGIRSDEDFLLPTEKLGAAAAAPELVAATQRHLLSIGSLDSAARPQAREAKQDAEALRDHAVASAKRP